jgi:peptidyl-prolyl cis-trans isomerase A (cyclophilin A)
MRALLAPLLVAALLAGCASPPAASPTASDTGTTTGPPTAPVPTTSQASSTAPPADACADADRSRIEAPANHTLVAIDLTLGCIVVQLYDEKAPITAGNFRTYVAEGYYNGTLIHRIAKQFVAQGGGWGEDGGRRHPTYAPIRNEAKTSGLRNLQYTLSMARTDKPDSATTEFFINLIDQPGLDPGGYSPDGYAVFAIVVRGRDVVDGFAQVPVGRSNLHHYCLSIDDRGGGSCPVDPVVVRSMRILA